MKNINFIFVIVLSVLSLIAAEKSDKPLTFWNIHLFRDPPVAEGHASMGKSLHNEHMLLHKEAVNEPSTKPTFVPSKRLTCFIGSLSCLSNSFSPFFLFFFLSFLFSEGLTHQFTRRPTHRPTLQPSSNFFGDPVKTKPASTVTLDGNITFGGLKETAVLWDMDKEAVKGALSDAMDIQRTEVMLMKILRDGMVVTTPTSNRRTKRRQLSIVEARKTSLRSGVKSKATDDSTAVIYFRVTHPVPEGSTSEQSIRDISISFNKALDMGFFMWSLLDYEMRYHATAFNEETTVQNYGITPTVEENDGSANDPSGSEVVNSGSGGAVLLILLVVLLPIVVILCVICLVCRLVEDIVCCPFRTASRA
jgi:hypothetical protein